LLGENRALFIRLFQARRQATVEQTVYQQSQSHGTAPYSRLDGAASMLSKFPTHVASADADANPDDFFFPRHLAEAG
jgi:hypothetical protein